MPDKIVFLLQGGGALGSYQVGVCEALIKNNYSPDWVVGTSIGAINAAIIAGNTAQKRIEKLHEFWNTIVYPMPGFIGLRDNVLLQEFQNLFHAQLTTAYGQPNFFTPRLINPWLFSASTPDKISFYDTSELRSTLNKVIDFNIINQQEVRLTLGAVRIKGSEFVRFDNFHHVIGPEHIMASCALPPGFPAVKIDEEYYWDGGLSSNTPFSIVLEEKMPQQLLCFIVNLFSNPERVPATLMDVLKFRKEIEFSSRHQEVLHYFCELHYLQHALNVLAGSVKNNHELDKAIKIIEQYGHPTSLNIVRFHYRDQPENLWSKDFNFSPQAIKEHWQAGYNDATNALNKPAWMNVSLDQSGAVIHEC